MAGGGLLGDLSNIWQTLVDDGSSGGSGKHNSRIDSAYWVPQHDARCHGLVQGLLTDTGCIAYRTVPSREAMIGARQKA